MSSLIDHVPRHLLEELLEGSWLPIVGAGFSRNAVVQGGSSPVSWPELGAALQRDVDGADASTGALEVISGFEQAFGRVALIDRTASLIRAHDAQPGSAHLAFAKVGFTDVITTNFDFLLERAYEKVGKGCLPVVDETQLSTSNRYTGPRLIKFHGDINHPGTMVITEDDYDNFLQTYPLLATSVTAMLVERTGILVGYSLDDPDTRQLLVLIKRRLGKMYRPLWTIQVEAPLHVVSRYERRGVKVINLPKGKGQTVGGVLQQFFEELARYWREGLPEKSVSADDRVTADFRVPDEPSRMCYFAIPANLIGWYRDLVFPEVEAAGMVPVTARDVFSPPGALSAKIDTLVGRALLIVAEIGDPSSEYEASLALAQKNRNSVLLIATDAMPVGPSELKDVRVLRRPARFDADPDDFVGEFRHWLSLVSRQKTLDTSEPARLLAHREFGAALISAVSLLEVSLSDLFGAETRTSPRAVTLRSMLKEAEMRRMFSSSEERRLIEEATYRRNETIHTRAPVSAAESRRFVDAILNFVHRFR